MANLPSYVTQDYFDRFKTPGKTNYAFANFPGLLDARGNLSSPISMGGPRNAFDASGALRPGGGAGGGGMNYGTSIGQGGIGANPNGVGFAPPKSAKQQMFNRPAYQQNRVTAPQMADMERANADRYRAEVMPLQNAFNRSWNAANQQQRFNETSAANQASNQFFDLANSYQNQQYDMNRQNMQSLMPLLGSFFNGF